MKIQCECDDSFTHFFPGIYGVGKAAVNKPALVVLKHKPPGATKNIALCGKGIVYDTGGLSIKGKVWADMYYVIL